MDSSSLSFHSILQHKFHLGIKQTGLNETLMASGWETTALMDFNDYGIAVTNDLKCRALSSGIVDGKTERVQCDGQEAPSLYKGLCQKTPCISMSGVPCQFPFRSA